MEPTNLIKAASDELSRPRSREFLPGPGRQDPKSKFALAPKTDDELIRA